MQNEKIYLSIAGFVIEVSFKKQKDSLNFTNRFIALTKDFYSSFLTDYSNLNIDYRIEVIYERAFHTLQRKKKNRLFINFYDQISARKCRTFYHISGIHFQIIIRKITHDLLVKNNGFILHASAVQKSGKAYVFLGDSGAGKSTIMTLLSSEFTPMGDDTVILRKQAGIYYCYSSSAIEKNAWFPKKADKVPLSKVFFLRQNTFHTASFLPDKEKIIRLLGKQVYTDIDDLANQFSNITKFVNSFDRFYRLDFSLKDTVHLGRIITE